MASVLASNNTISNYISMSPALKRARCSIFPMATESYLAVHSVRGNTITGTWPPSRRCLRVVSPVRGTPHRLPPAANWRRVSARPAAPLPPTPKPRPPLPDWLQSDHGATRPPLSKVVESTGPACGPCPETGRPARRPATPGAGCDSGHGKGECGRRRWSLTHLKSFSAGRSRNFGSARRVLCNI